MHKDDGRVNVRISQKTKGLADLLVPALRSRLDLLNSHAPILQHKTQQAPGTKPSPGEAPYIADRLRNAPLPLNVVIHVVGSRGDVQPFVALGKVLKADYGHRVRLATHPVFKTFVEEHGLEFFTIGGDPSELMSFMVGILVLGSTKTQADTFIGQESWSDARVRYTEERRCWKAQKRHS